MYVRMCVCSRINNKKKKDHQHALVSIEDLLDWSSEQRVIDI